LKNATGRRWLFVGEDFDRAGIRPNLLEDRLLPTPISFKIYAPT
jgi:hypothetical protein